MSRANEPVSEIMQREFVTLSVGDHLDLVSPPA